MTPDNLSCIMGSKVEKGERIVILVAVLGSLVLANILSFVLVVVEAKAEAKS